MFAVSPVRQTETPQQRLPLTVRIWWPSDAYAPQDLFLFSSISLHDEADWIS